MAVFEREIITTKDGSHSISVPGLNEQYHSIHGAKQEAEHVFLKMGLDYFPEARSLDVFEVGFGTGLNALLTALYAEQNQKQINYTSIEKYPVTKAEIDVINFGELMGCDDLFQSLHASDWGELEKVNDLFALRKLQMDLKRDELPGTYDVIYFDAFAPNKQPDMWSVEVFEKMKGIMKSGGCLVTYCCQGQAKRNMKAAGLSIEKVQGPPGKREMLRAFKP